MGFFWVTPGKQTFVDENGAPLVGGKLFHYVPGTDTFKDTYQNPQGSILNENPIPLDGRGQAIIWGSGLYRQRLLAVDGTEIWDRVTGMDLSGYALADLSNVSGADLAAKAFIARDELDARDLYDRFGEWADVAAFGADGTGDDTGPLQAAMGLGKPVQLHNATYSISAFIGFHSTETMGTILRGNGGAGQGGEGVMKSSIRPTAAVTSAFVIAGDGYGGFQQRNVVQDLDIDMAAMDDLATSIAFDQGQSFDVTYRNIGTRNVGDNRLGWKIRAGAYVTLLENCTGARVDIEGENSSNEATTIAMMNCDLIELTITQANTVNVHGGAIQGRWSDAAGPARIVYLPPGTTPVAYPTNTTGLYAWQFVKLDIASRCTFHGVDFEQGNSPGIPSTYDDGVHGVLPLLAVVSVLSTSKFTEFYGCGFNGCYLLDAGQLTYVANPPNLAYPYNYSSRWCPNAYMRKTTNDNIPDSSWFTIPFDTPVQFAPGEFTYDAVNNRLVCQRQGSYVIQGRISVEGFATAFTRANGRVAINAYFGAFTIDFNEVPAGGADMSPVGGGAINLLAGDTIELQVFQNSGSSKLCFGGAGTFLSVMKVD